MDAITAQGCLLNAAIAYHACFGVLYSKRLYELFVFLSLTFVVLANNPFQPELFFLQVWFENTPVTIKIL